MLGHNIIPHHHHGDHTHGNIPHHTHDHNDEGQNYHTFSEFIASSPIQNISVIQFDELPEADEYGDNFQMSHAVCNLNSKDYSIDYVQPPPDVGHVKSRRNVGAHTHRGPPIFS